MQSWTWKVKDKSWRWKSAAAVIPNSDLNRVGIGYRPGTDWPGYVCKGLTWKENNVLHSVTMTYFIMNINSSEFCFISGTKNKIWINFHDNSFSLAQGLKMIHAFDLDMVIVYIDNPSCNGGCTSSQLKHSNWTELEIPGGGSERQFHTVHTKQTGTK